MAQGTVYRTRDGLDLVCRVQIDLGIETPYILCAPVVPRDEWGTLVPRLHLEVEVLGEPHVILMTQMVALPQSALGPIIADLAHRRDDLVAAAELLVAGF